MANNIADKFIGALSELESERDAELIVSLFDGNCEVINVAATEIFRGTEGARRFWTNYREGFKDVCSVFQNETYSDNNAALEWTTEGNNKNGQKIRYVSVGIIETKDEKITRFYAYFGTKNLGRRTTERENGGGSQIRVYNKLVESAGSARVHR